MRELAAGTYFVRAHASTTLTADHPFTLHLQLPQKGAISAVTDNINRDTIFGGEGNDTLEGGKDIDQLFGGGGADTTKGDDIEFRGPSSETSADTKQPASSADSISELRRTPIDPVVAIPDVALRVKLADALGIATTVSPTGTPIFARDMFASDLSSLVSLDLSNSGISNLSGLQYATNLRSLNLAHNFISDLSPLVPFNANAEGILGAVHLEYLVIDDNLVSDLSPLESMSSLKRGVSGTVYSDSNANGTKDASEAGLANITVWIDKDHDSIVDAGETTTTDASGRYSFNMLPTNTYNLAVQTPTGWRQVIPVGAGTHSINLIPGRMYVGRDFGLFQVIDLAGDRTVNEGANVAVMPVVQDPNTANGSNFAYLWTVTSDNGQSVPSSTDPSFSFLPALAGNYTVQLQLTDLDDGNRMYSSTIVVHVTNVAPTVNAGGSYSIQEGSGLTLQGAGSDPGSAATLSYSWDINGDGVFGDASGANPTVTWAQLVALGITNGPASVTNVRLQVSDGLTSTISGPTTLNVLNAPPTTNAGGPYTVVENGVLVLSASATDPNPSDSLSFAWDLDNDGQFDDAVGSSVNVPWTTLVQLGVVGGTSFPVRVQVTDSDGAAAVSSAVDVTIQYILPTADAGGPYAIVEGESLNLNGSGSDPNNSGSLTFAWDLNGDDIFTDADGANAVVTWAELVALGIGNGPSSLGIRLRVDDGVDGVTISAPVNLSIADTAPTIELLGDGQTVQGTQFVLTLGNITDPGADTVTAWTVHWGDGTSETFTDAGDKTHVYNGFGPMIIAVDLVDNDGVHVNAGTKVIAVQSTLAIDGPSTWTEASELTLTADGTPDNVASYLWTVTRDGQAFETGTSTNEAELRLTPPDDGEYVVTLTVMDDDDDSVVVTKTIAVANRLPTDLSISAPAAGLEAMGSIELTGSATDPSGTNDPLTYAWTITRNGGVFIEGTGTSFSFTPEDNGLYVAILTAIDDEPASSGRSATTSVQIHVANLNPTNVSISGPASGLVGSAIAFTASAADPAGIDDPLEFEWSVTLSGNLVATGAGSDFSFTPLQAGSYLLTLTAWDDDGGSAVVSQAIDVIDPLPSDVTITGQTSGQEATPITLNASAITPSGHDATFTWDLDDDGLFDDAQGAQVTFTPADNGTLTVRVRATNDFGSNDAQTTLVIANRNPTSANISGPSSAVRGQPLTYTLTATDPSVVDQTGNFTFDIDWDGNGTVDQTVTGVSGIQVQHAYPTTGAFGIKLTATDKDGGASELGTFGVTVDALRLVNTAGVTNLVYGGTTGDDSIEFSQVDATTVLVKTLVQNGVAVNTSQTVSGVTGKVIAYGQSGNDQFVATALTSTAVEFHGGQGNDTLRGSKGNDQLFGEEDVDRIFGHEGNDSIDGGVGTDILYGEWENPGAGTVYGHDTIHGGDGNDEIYGDGDGGEGTSDAIYGDAGDDLIFGDGNIGKKVAVDTIHGGIGNDTIYGDSDGGEASSDLIYGEDGNDTIVADGSKGGKSASDTVYGGDGDDDIKGDGGEGASDSLLGEAGNDVIDTGKGSDYADGGEDSDLLIGGDGGEGSSDTLVGNSGNDVLIGGVGTDSLNGGVGEDLLVVSNYLPANANSARAIHAEWSSTRPFEERVANIKGNGTGPRNNGSDFLTPGTTVVDDNAVDTVFAGGSEKDWAFVKVTQDATPDLGIEDLLGPL
ncbi:MAG: PKD domain-containing protein [Planctomycetota bacterium]